MSATSQLPAGSGGRDDAYPLEVNPWVVAITVMLPTFMQILDTSVANVALPHIAGGLGVDVQESTWTLTSYLVSNAIILPMSGWLASFLGRKRVLLYSVVLFTFSSFLCGIAPSLSLLVFFRIFQGAGGGVMQPISQAILLESFPHERRGLAMGIYGMGVVVAPIIGPTLGGWLSDALSWRWIFFINIPVGLISLFLVSLFIFDPPYLARKNWANIKTDYIGLGLISLGFGALQVFLDKGQTDDWFASRFILAMGVTALVSLAVLVIWELTHEAPVVNLRLLKDRNFGVSVLAMFMLGFILYGSIVLLPIFLQQLMGYTATLAGLVLSPGGILTLALMPIAGALVGRIDVRYLIISGLVIVAYSLFYMAGFTLQIDFRTAVVSRMIQGAGLALLFVPINAVAFYYIPKEKVGQGTGIINLVRNIGGSSGIAFATTMLARRSQTAQNVLIHTLTPLNPAYDHAVSGIRSSLIQRGVAPALADHKALGVLDNALRGQAGIVAYTHVFALLGVIALVAIVPAFFLKKSKGAVEPVEI
jgi:MFS transporter, DHA2 family, multidrug resistance protein